MNKTNLNIYCFLPNPDDLVSGGNIYNRFFLQALRTKGYAVKIVSQKDIQQTKFSDLPKPILLVDTLFMKDAASLLQTFSKDWFSILLVHHLACFYPPKNYSAQEYFEQYDRPLLKDYDALMTTSFYTREVLERFQVAQKIMVIPPALTIEAKASNRNTIKIKAIMVANLVERKGILPFLKGLSQVDNPSILEHLEIDLYGTDQIEEAYAQQCINLIDNHPFLKQIVRYQGVQDQMVLSHAYQRANLFISTAFMESFGMALQEAVAYQLPILALDRGNVAHHIVENQNGLLCQTMEELVAQLLVLTQNKALFRQLSDGAKAYTPYADYDWEDAVEQFKEQLFAICKDYYYI